MNNSTVIIKKVDKEWTAFNNDRKIGKSACKGCIIKLMQRLTATSLKYNNIIVVANNGEVLSEFPTGANHVRNNQDN